MHLSWPQPNLKSKLELSLALDLIPLWGLHINIEFDISLETDAESFPVKPLKLGICWPDWFPFLISETWEFQFRVPCLVFQSLNLILGFRQDQTRTGVSTLWRERGGHTFVSPLSIYFCKGTWTSSTSKSLTLYRALLHATNTINDDTWCVIVIQCSTCLQ